jgi:N-acetylneuraminate synthase
MSTAFDEASLAFLGKLGMPAVKIPSGDVTCAPLLLQAAQLRQRLIVSSGMCTLADLERALGVMAYGLLNDDTPKDNAAVDAAYFSAEGREALARHVTLLHCVTQYPAPPEAVNLRAMDTMAQAFGLPVGYSDHTLGIEMSIAAVARGATVIEKHFTVDRTLPGPDHAASLEPDELSAMVRAIRNVEVGLGSPRKLPATAERANREVVRRSIVAKRAIAAGEILSLDMLAFKRPSTGLSPMETWELLGRPARRDYDTDEPIEP